MRNKKRLRSQKRKSPSFKKEVLPQNRKEHDLKKWLGLKTERGTALK